MAWTRARLLEVAEGKPSVKRWEALVEGIDELSDEDPEGFEAIIEALDAKLAGWPATLRQAPASWWELVQEGSLPWGWELVRALEVGEGEEVDQGDAMAQITHLDLRGLPMTPGAEALGVDDLDGYEALEVVDVSGLGLSSLDALRDRPALVEVEAYECHRLEDLSALGDGLRLERLELSPLRAAHVEAIGAATSLRELVIDHGSGLGSLEAWRGLTRLESLTLRGLEGLRSLEGAEALTALELLQIEDAEALDDISALAGLPALRDVSLTGCGALRDLTPLTRLPALESLDLSGGHPARDDAPLASLNDVKVTR